MSGRPDGDQRRLELDAQKGEDIPQEIAAPPTVSVPDTGVLATNDRNLMYMLAAGLLMPPAGFRGKHYRDPLSAFPGWLPLFVGPNGAPPAVPTAAVESSTQEAGHLSPVLVEVDLTGLRGTIHAHGPDGWSERHLEEGVSSDETLLLFPAPLPTTRIRLVSFRSTEERKAAERGAGDVRNVAFDGFELIAAQAAFESASTAAWPPPDGPAERTVALAAAQAAGGAMAMLQRLANRGDLSLATARSAFEPRGEPPDDSFFGVLPQWIESTCGQGSEATPRTGSDLFWSGVDSVVTHRDQASGGSPNDALVETYRQAARGMEEEHRPRAEALVSTLESLGGGFGGETVSGMLAAHPRTAGRAAVLFLLRGRSSELLELMRRYPELGERDRLAAGILFGVRDGWLGLPHELRGTPELARAVTHRMAALAHRLDGSGCDLGSEPPRVRPLREVFGNPDGWGQAEQEAAQVLADNFDWWDCLRTTVSLAQGSFELRIDGDRVCIESAGRPPQVETRMDQERFLDHLARTAIDPRREAKIRAVLRRHDS